MKNDFDIPHRVYQQILSHQEIKDKIVKNPKNSLTLSEFVNLCYCVLVSIQHKKNKIDQILKNDITQIVNVDVKAQNMPCLIYQHLVETYSSLVQASTDEDQLLVNAEVDELTQTIDSFNPLREYGDYQSFNHLEIDENMTDAVIKQKFYNKVNYLMDKYEKLGDTSKFKSGKDKKQQTMNIIKQKQQIIKARFENKLKPTLAKFAGRLKKCSEEETKREKEIESRDFVLSVAIRKVVE